MQGFFTPLPVLIAAQRLNTGNGSKFKVRVATAILHSDAHFQRGADLEVRGAALTGFFTLMLALRAMQCAAQC